MKRTAFTPVLAAVMIVLALPAAAAPGAPAPRIESQVCSNLAPFCLLPPTLGFTTGCGRRFNLKLGASLGPDGNYIMLDYPSCGVGTCAGQTGTTGMSCQAVSGYQCCRNSGDVINTIAGTNIALLSAGLASRISGDTDARSGICFSAYTGNGARVVKAPYATAVAGSGIATVTGFGEIFLSSPPTGTGNTTTFLVEFVTLDPTPTAGGTWGRVKQIYR